MCGAGGVGGIGEDGEGFADLREGVLVSDMLLGLHGEAEAAALNGRRDLVGELGGAGAFFLGVEENAEALEALFLDKFEEGLEVVVGFAGETDDEGGADGEVGDVGAEVAKERLNVLARGFALHCVEDVGVDVLEGDVDVGDDFGVMCDGADEFVAPMGWVGVEDSDPEVAFDLGKFVEEVDEGWAAGGVNGLARAGAAGPEVHAVVGCVLADEVDFADALLDELADFADNGVDGATAVAAAHARDDAEGAGVVAAFGNFYVGEVRGGEPEARHVPVGEEAGVAFDKVEGFVGRLRGILEEGEENVAGVGDMVEAEEGVHLVAQFARKLRREALGEAAGDNQLLPGAFAHAPFLMGFQNCFDRFFLCCVDEAAGIDDQNVRFFGNGGEFEPSHCSTSKHELGVNEIFCTAKTDKRNFRWGRRGEMVCHVNRVN